MYWTVYFVLFTFIPAVFSVASTTGHCYNAAGFEVYCKNGTDPADIGGCGVPGSPEERSGQCGDHSVYSLCPYLDYGYCFALQQ